MKTKIFLLALSVMLLAFVTPKTAPIEVKLVHAGYTTTYNTRLHYPVLVEWWTTKARVQCPEDKLERKDQFAKDPLLPEETDLAQDYVGSGLDRGHMCPAADNECNAQFLTECFYFSNMAPQYHSLNAGDWKRLEERTRSLALDYDSVKVWCGSIGSAKKIGSVTVPTKCWKAIYIKKTKTWEYYIFNNTSAKPIGLESWQVKKPDFEKITGYKLQAN